MSCIVAKDCFLKVLMLSKCNIKSKWKDPFSSWGISYLSRHWVGVGTVTCPVQLKLFSPWQGDTWGGILYTRHSAFTRRLLSGSASPSPPPPAADWPNGLDMVTWWRSLLWLTLYISCPNQSISCELNLQLGLFWSPEGKSQALRRESYQWTHEYITYST